MTTTTTSLGDDHRVVDRLPDFCPFYKPLLVEHFSMLPTPLQLHYGKCSLIGRTRRCDDATSATRLLLCSTRLLGLPLEYQCADGATQVPLHTAAGCAAEPPADEWVRVFGEATLADAEQRPAATNDDVVHATVKDVLLMMA